MQAADMGATERLIEFRPGFYAKHGKRLLDLVIIMAVLALFALPMVIVAILVKADSEGDVFFVQERVGKEGKPFRLYKFRTMVPGAANMGAGILVEKNDPRVTALGRWLRVSGLDELPQSLNILRGDMSVIGPRPTLQYQVDQYTPFQRQRLLVRPGITGWAQVQGRKSLPWTERIKLDVQYVENLTFVMDIKILLKTIPTLFSRESDQAQSDYWKEKKKKETGGNKTT